MKGALCPYFPPPCAKRRLASRWAFPAFLDGVVFWWHCHSRFCHSPWQGVALPVFQAAVALDHLLLPKKTSESSQASVFRLNGEVCLNWLFRIFKLSISGISAARGMRFDVPAEG